jgi:NADPH-dependent glutamate synthase beta subunit-like oxidoreductase
MSSLAAALAAQKPLPKGSRCTIGETIESLNDIDKKALLNALDIGSGMTATDIARALRVEGYTVASQTVARHRRGDCFCDAG